MVFFISSVDYVQVMFLFVFLVYITSRGDGKRGGADTYVALGHLDTVWRRKSGEREKEEFDVAAYYQAMRCRKNPTADITKHKNVVTSYMAHDKRQTNSCQQPAVAQSRRGTLWRRPGVRPRTRTRATGRPGCWSSVAWCCSIYRHWARGTRPVVAARSGGAPG